MQNCTDILGHDGPFSHHLTGFAPRLQQQEMAEQVEKAISDRSILVAEAGTGTGKTFAYLVPALLSSEKVIVSTGTKNLQDQLFYRDLPLVRKALQQPGKVALLKGRSNYLCHYRLDLYRNSPRVQNPALHKTLIKIKRWSEVTKSGDTGELTDVAEDSPLWPFVTSTADNCLGQECPSIADCCVMKARRKAQEADLVVVNHHLFFADLSLKEEGIAELLPGANAVIFDEAHQLPEVASNFFGQAYSSNQLLELVSDIQAAIVDEAVDMQLLGKLADRLEYTAKLFRRVMPDNSNRITWKVCRQIDGVDAALKEMGETLGELLEQLEVGAERGKVLANCFERCGELYERFQKLTGETPEGFIHWVGVFNRSVVVNLTPMDIADIFREYMKSRPCGWIFTSATLTVANSFEHICRTLGIDDAVSHSWDSPFDYMNQSVLYIPTGLPEPSSSEYGAEVVAQALPVLRASEGRAFMLFTSHRALQEAAGLLEDELDYPLFIQGSMPRSQLLAKFRKTANAILLGTSSFWEGVDVRGEALSCVIIDKLPFASPGDPLLQARIDAIRERGGNPFRDYQLPQAVIALKQGVGRLIRDVNDRGVLMICDPRTLNKSYGRIFIDSLPRMKRTRNLKRVEQFFEEPLKEPIVDSSVDSSAQ